MHLLAIFAPVVLIFAPVILALIGLIWTILRLVGEPTEVMWMVFALQCVIVIGTTFVARSKLKDGYDWWLAFGWFFALGSAIWRPALLLISDLSLLTYKNPVYLDLAKP